MPDVVVVGAGPTGLMVAAELALAGVDAVVLERRESPELAGRRAGGFHSRTLEILDQRGIVDRFLSEGQVVQVAGLGSTKLDLSRLPTRFPHSLGLWQHHIERILRGWVEELGVPVRWGVEVTGFEEDDDGVDVALAPGGSVRAAYLVGADGGRSAVRRAAGIDFVGPDATRSHLIAEVQVSEETPKGITYDAFGIHALGVLEDGHTVRMVVTERELGGPTEPTLADLRRVLTEVYGTDFGVHDPGWIGRFTDATRQAAAYRLGRVALAGDAAHVHHPAGGQGIGLGLQDAVNLGWKLASVAKGRAGASLLDTYHAERHPAGARVLRHTIAQSTLQRRDGRVEALDETIATMLEYDGPLQAMGALVSGLDVTYDLGEGHPLLGRRLPDLDLETPEGPRRAYSWLHGARPMLLDLAGPDDLYGTQLGPWRDQVQHVHARYDGPWELPVIGEVTAPTGVLVRPDGHVAWVGEATTDGLAAALTTWFGARTASAETAAPAATG